MYSPCCYNNVSINFALPTTIKRRSHTSQEQEVCAFQEHKNSLLQDHLCLPPSLSSLIVTCFLSFLSDLQLWLPLDDYGQLDPMGSNGNCWIYLCCVAPSPSSLERSTVGPICNRSEGTKRTSRMNCPGLKRFIDPSIGASRVTASSLKVYCTGQIFDSPMQAYNRNE